MAGSGFGTIFHISTWGESHGPSIGVVIDGCPAGLSLCEEDIQKQLDRRKPGQSQFTTSRSEADRVQILSGVFEGKTTGTSIALEVKNENQRSGDYAEIAEKYRPGHADYTYDQKFGFRDYRGGGRSSARETIGRVAAGAVAMKLLSELGISVLAWTESVGPISCNTFDAEEIERNPLRMPDAEAAAKAAEYAAGLREEKDSSGGVIACRASGVPAGLGEPVFDKLDALLSHALVSVGAVKGIEIGDGFRAAMARGSENNDAFLARASDIQVEQHGMLCASSNRGPCHDTSASASPDKPVKASNHAGGILGGISDGDDILLRIAFKPTPSIYREQQTVTRSGEATTLSIKGRHDPLVMPRAVPVVEAMTALVLADALLLNMSSRMEYIRKIYR